MPPAVVKEGDVLAGKYRVERVLGQGGMGQVVAAMHLQLKERVALKFLLPQAAAEPEFAARFQREAELMAKLRSEHVARVTDVGLLETGAPYMVMEYLQGSDLRSILRETGPLPLDVALDYFLQACEGIGEAHALGIVHRDIKPTNLFVTQRRDGSAVVKVLDFGISKAPDEKEIEKSDLTGVASVLGSPRYMPPEQLRSSRDVDARADVWAIAAILQEMLTGETPFTGPNTTALCAAIVGDPPTRLREKWPEAPEALENVLLRCFEKEVSARMASIADLATAVVEAVAPDDPAAVLAAERIARMSGRGPAALSTSTTGRRSFGSRSGAYVPASAGGGSGPVSATPTPSRMTPPPADRTEVSASGASTVDKTEASARRKRVGIIAAAVLLVGVVIVGVTLSSKGTASSRNAAAASGDAHDQPTASERHDAPPPTSAALVVAPPPTALASVDASSPPVDKTSATLPPRTQRGGGPLPPRVTKKDEPAPPTAPPAPPPPPPKEKPIGNPLDDRQ